jgi:hypothetical protein
MTRIEIDDLRLRWESVLKVTLRTPLTWSSTAKAESALRLQHSEEQALYEFARVRRELLDALTAICHAE